MKLWVKASLAVAGMAIGMSIPACTSDSRGTGDAPVAGKAGDNTAADIINFPDHYPNVATKCDGHGHRLFVPTHDKTDVPITVIADETCQGGAAK